MLEVRFLAGEGELNLCVRKNVKNKTNKQKHPARRKAREESAVVQAFNPSVQEVELG